MHARDSSVPARRAPLVGARLRAWVGQAGLHVAAACAVVLLFTLPWGPHWPFAHAGVPAPSAGLVTNGFNFADLLVAGILAGWLPALLFGQAQIIVRPVWVTAPLLLLAVAATVAVVPALNRQDAWRFAVRTWCLTGCYFYLRSRPLSAEYTILLLAPGLACNGLLAIAQAVHQDPLGLTWLDEPQMHRLAPGTATVLAAGQLRLRAYGVLPHANVLGGLLAAGLPLVAALLYASRPRSRKMSGVRLQRMRTALVVTTLALLVAGLALSFSRSAWLGLLAAAIYAIVRLGLRWRPSGRAAVVAAAVGLVMALLLALQWDGLSTRLYPRDRQEIVSIQQRLFLQDLTLHVIAWRPLTGVGGNNLVAAEARFRSKATGSTSGLLPVHNTYLLAQAELGPLGGLGWAALMLAPLMGLLVGRAGARDDTHRQAIPGPLDGSLPATIERDRRWRAFAGAALVVVAVAGLFDFYIWVNEPVALLWIVSLAIFTRASDVVPYSSRQYP